MDHAPLTRQALCAKAEELAVELVRWKVWHLAGRESEEARAAQAMHALAMVLIELLDSVHGSYAAAQVELARAALLLGAPRSEAQDDAAFLQAHGLRFEAETGEPDAPSDT
jgi:hypothetical protein